MEVRESVMEIWEFDFTDMNEGSLILYKLIQL